MSNLTALLLQTVMDSRTKITTVDGFTCYPRDDAQRDRWLAQPRFADAKVEVPSADGQNWVEA